jgi:hypothetical protein
MRRVCMDRMRPPGATRTRVDRAAPDLAAVGLQPLLDALDLARGLVEAGVRARPRLQRVALELEGLLELGHLATAAVCVCQKTSMSLSRSGICWCSCCLLVPHR